MSECPHREGCIEREAAVQSLTAERDTWKHRYDEVSETALKSLREVRAENARLREALGNISAVHITDRAFQAAVEMREIAKQHLATEVSDGT